MTASTSTRIIPKANKNNRGDVSDGSFEPSTDAFGGFSLETEDGCGSFIFFFPSWFYSAFHVHVQKIRSISTYLF
jgi:hypothetical protein